MYTMLLDDEQWIVLGLAQILKRHDPDMEIRSFTEPFEALQSIGERMPDLLITDIRMPSMNGLELIQRVRAMGLRFYAVLTGLDDVGLVQQSLRLQAADYLIKPVNKAELYRLIDRVKQQLSELEDRSEAQKRNALRLCAMYGEADGQAAVSASEYQTALIVRYRDGKPTLPEAACSVFDVSVELWRMDECCWLYLSRQPQCSAMESALSGGLGNARFALFPYQPQTLHTQFLRVMSDEGDRDDNPVALFCASPQNDTVVATQLLKQIGASDDPPGTLDAFCRAVGVTLPYWEATRLAAEVPRLAPEKLGALLRALPAAPSPRSSDVRTTLDWMRQHFREHITLSQAANNVYLQANYFTTLFKKETGSSFIQYLNELRVDEACRQILRQPGLSFEEIAEKSGFASVRYFFASFRKYVGQTPGDFRQSAQQSGFVR